MNCKLLNTSYQVEDYLIECNDEKWTKVIKIIGQSDNIDDIIKQVQDQKLGTVFYIKEI